MASRSPVLKTALVLGGISFGFLFRPMKKGNDEGFPKDRGLVTKEKRGFDVLASGVMGLKLSD